MFHGSSHSDYWLVLGSKVGDALIIVFTLVASVSIHEPIWGPRYTVAALVAAITFLFSAEVANLHRPWRGETVARQFFHILFVWGWTFFVLLLLAYVLKTTGFYSRLSIGLWLVATPFLLSAWRVIERVIFSYYARDESRKGRAVVWGSGQLCDQFTRMISQSSWLGLRLVGCLQDDLADGSSSDFDAAGSGPEPDADKMDMLVQCAQDGKFDILYIVLPATEQSQITELVDRLADTTVSVYMVPDYFTSSLALGRWTNLDGIPLVSIYDTPFWGASGWVKRIQDIVLSSVFLLIVAVPMLFIAIAIKLSSPGPVLFKQHRYGINGKDIVVWKFRSMRVCEDGTEIPQATRDDPRITRLGAFLRRTSLDELPQFINVLFGTMSIVGPRPHAVAHNELYRKQIKGYMLRHKVRPGITGWAQINGWRGETDDLYKMEKRIEYDLWYLRNWSLWLDLKIILLTAMRGFGGTNAY